MGEKGLAFISKEIRQRKMFGTIVSNPNSSESINKKKEQKNKRTKEQIT